jgi:hypothetical protein
MNKRVSLILSCWSLCVGSWALAADVVDIKADALLDRMSLIATHLNYWRAR